MRGDITTEQKFEGVYEQYIRRDGAKKLLENMKKDGFFTQPASAKYHLNIQGGLAAHSLHVYERLVKMHSGKYSMETLAVCGLLHDICKIDSYVETSEGYQYNKKSFPLGHGEKSVILILQHMRLTPEEILAIRWHMGAFDHAFQGGCMDYNRAADQCELVALLHIADMQASQLDERR